MKINSYKDLIVWQKSILLVKEVYKLCHELPKSEQFILVSQIKRAAISIPSNIAEGYRRKTKQEFLQFLNIANGSAAELETQLIIAKELYSEVNTTVVLALLAEIQKMLCALILKLKYSH